ncbi:hypothetical protein EMIT0180MI3_11407 [Priestia megaterium]
MAGAFVAWPAADLGHTVLTMVCAELFDLFFSKCLSSLFFEVTLLCS